MNKENERLYNICTFILYTFIFMATIFSFVELIIEFKYWSIILITLVIFSIYYYFKYKNKQKDNEEKQRKSNLIHLIDFSNTIIDLDYSNLIIIKYIKLNYLRITITLKNNITFEYEYSIKYGNNINLFDVNINLLDNLLSKFDWNTVSGMEHYFINKTLNDYINKNLTNIIKNN